MRDYAVCGESPHEATEESGSLGGIESVPERHSFFESEFLERPSTQSEGRRAHTVTFESEAKSGYSRSVSNLPNFLADDSAANPKEKDDTEPVEQDEEFEGVDDSFKRIAMVHGVVLEAKNLPPTGAWSGANPFCVVKGIKSNNHLVHIHRTQVFDHTVHPQWQSSFTFECPISYGLNQLVGLKFFIYDAEEGKGHDLGRDNFLGGADLDLYEAPNGRSFEQQLELSGANIHSAKKKTSSTQAKKSLLAVKIRILFDSCARPPSPEVLLMRSLCSLHQVTSVQCKIVKATGLRNADFLGKSDPVCIVRLVRLSGKYEKIHQTKVSKNTLKPNWQDTFYCTFGTDQEDPDEPMVLLFDIWDSDGNDADQGDHLGSCMIMLAEIPTQEPLKKKMDLHSESQRLEKMYDREGKAGMNKNVKHSDSIERMRTRKDLSNQNGTVGKNLLLGLKNMKFGKKNSKCMIEIQLTVDREERPMPFLRFNDKVSPKPGKPPGQPMRITEEQDVQDACNLQDWKFTLWKPDKRLVNEAKSGTRPKLASLYSKDKIVFVGGVIRGASGLINADVTGKSDPYCIVEGVTAEGDKVFIHRTKVVSNKLTPIWMESFLFPLTDEKDLVRLNFTVWDSDQASKGGGINADSSQDDLLGRTTIDLTYFRNGEVLQEDVPLSGVRVVPDSKKNQKDFTGFRRVPRICVDVRVERRLKPIYEVRRDQIVWTPVPKHSVSYDPPLSRIYHDPSQKAMHIEPHEAIAKTALKLYEAGQYLERTRQRSTRGTRDHFEKWLRPQRSGWRSGKVHPEFQNFSTDESVEELDEEQLLESLFEREDRERREKHALQLATEQTDIARDFSGICRSGLYTGKRAASLPTLWSRFGHKTGPAARQFSSMRPTWVDNLQLQDNTIADTLIHTMKSKPCLRENLSAGQLTSTI